MTQRTCTVEGCNNKHKAVGLCRLHYYKKRDHGDPLWKKEPSERRNVVLTFKVTEQEKTDYLQIARQTGNGELSSLIRLLLDTVKRRHDKKAVQA